MDETATLPPGYATSVQAAFGLPPSMLGASFRAAVEIRAMNREGLPATIPALKERLGGEVSLPALYTALNTLADYGITEGHYGPVGDGWAGYRYEIAASVAPFFDALTEKLRQGEVMYAPEAADAGL